MIQLEPKSRKFTCPSCGARQKFKRYVDERGEYLGSRVGRCDRESSCGYHYTPKQFYADNPDKLERKPKSNKPKQNYLRQTVSALPVIEATASSRSLDFIPYELFEQTLHGYEQNAFVKFLTNTFPNCAEEIGNVLKMYFIGTFQDYTCFPYIDGFNRICKGKLIKYYPETGRRLKGEFDTSSLVSKLKAQGKITGDFNYAQIFFGEHLLKQSPNKTIAVVEAEKSAIIGSLCFPEFVWLGSHSKTWLKPERLAKLSSRKIILYPDADGFNEWQRAAQEARRLKADVAVSNLIETHSTHEQKAKGYDLADFLIEQQNEINEENKIIDAENAKLETIKSNKILSNQFNELIDEQKAILIVNGELSEDDAEQICTQPENVWRVIRSMSL